MSRPAQAAERSIAWVLGMFETGLAAARSLGRVGIPVWGVDSDPSMPGSRSRFVRFRLAPSPITHPHELCAWLVEQGRAHPEPGVLLPATDAYVAFVSRFRDELHRCFRFALPDPEVVDALLDKVRHARLAEAVGERCPDTHELNTDADAEAVGPALHFPVFIKGRCAHVWRLHFDSKGFVARDAGEFEEAWARIREAGTAALVQEIVPGPATNHFEVSFYRSVQPQRQILALLGVRKLRQFPAGFGVGSLVETWHRPDVIQRTLEFAKALDFTGIGNIEYKLDERSGELYLIELNARLWQQNSQAAACAINFPVIAYRDLLGLPVRPCLDFPDGLKWLDVPADFQAFWDAHQRGQLSAVQWMRSWRGVKSCASLAWDDPLPTLQEYEYGLKALKLPVYLLRHLRPARV